MVLLAPAAAAQDPGIPDTVHVDSIGAFTNTRAIVPVNFYNDEPLGGLEVTLHFSSPDVHVDSFSFAGGRLQSYSVKGTYTPSGGFSIYCVPFAGEPTIPAASGLLGRLYLSWSVGISPQLVSIDTITIVNVDVSYSTRFSTASAVAFTPKYRRGWVKIDQGFGCCIGTRGNVDGDPTDAVTLPDLTRLIGILFRGMAPADCPEEANINGDATPQPTVADITYLIAYLFRGGPPPAPCQ